WPTLPRDLGSIRRPVLTSEMIPRRRLSAIAAPREAGADSWSATLDRGGERTVRTDDAFSHAFTLRSCWPSPPGRYAGCCRGSLALPQGKFGQDLVAVFLTVHRDHDHALFERSGPEHRSWRCQ